MTKYRRKILDGAAIVWMQTHCANVCERMRAQLLALDGKPDRGATLEKVKQYVKAQRASPVS